MKHVAEKLHAALTELFHVNAGKRYAVDGGCCAVFMTRGVDNSRPIRPYTCAKAHLAARFRSARSLALPH